MKTYLIQTFDVAKLFLLSIHVSEPNSHRNTAGNLLTRNIRLWKRERETNIRLWWRRVNITASNSQCASSNTSYCIYLKNIKKVRMWFDAGIIFPCFKCHFIYSSLPTIFNFTSTHQQEDIFLLQCQIRPCLTEFSCINNWYFGFPLCTQLAQKKE